MGRRRLAGAILVSCLVHLGVLVVGVAMGWLPVDGGSLVLLSLAFGLALFALFAAVWVLRTLDRHGFSVAEWVFDCRECGRPFEGDLGFCPLCGAHA